MFVLVLVIIFLWLLMFVDKWVEGGMNFYVAYVNIRTDGEDYNYVKIKILHRKLQGHAEPAKPFT